jgi:TP901 family phage tail tape measure protein
LAKEDDLSVNINVGVELDKASFKEAKDQLEFLTELKKELGFGPKAKIQVGGYSVQEPSKEASRKASSKFEKMGGRWDGSRIADDAEKALARELNGIAETLSRQLKLKFVPQVAESLNELEFKLPDSIDVFENLQEQIEDFIVTAAGKVVVSPAMLIAAAERVLKNNPNLSMPSQEGLFNPYKNKFEEFKKVGVTQDPKPAFQNVAPFDASLTQAFNEFIDKAISNNPQAADKISAFLEGKLKVLFSQIIDKAQAARARTFTSKGGAEGEDSLEGLVRYANNSVVKTIAQMEERFGLQAGTTAMFARGAVSSKFTSASGTAASDPQALLSVLVGEYGDEVTGALMSSLPDPAKVANPIAQVLMNPYILGDKFANNYQEELTKALNKKAPKVAEVISSKTAATTGGGGANNPDIELLRRYLSEQKALVEAKGKTFMAGLDTEFNSQIDEKLTELGMVIEDGSGKLVEIFKFLQLPGDTQAMYKGSAFPAGNARTPADLAKRAQLLGIPKEEIGVPGDSEANFLQYREKISKLVSILDLLSELGISLTGSSFQSAEAANIKKAIDYINSRSKDMGLDPLATPDLKNVFDPVALAKILAPASSELTKIFDSPEAKAGISGALGNLIKNIAQQFPEFIAKYSDQFRMSESGSTFEFKAAGGPAQAHYALTDAAASLIVKDFIEEFGGMAATMLVPVAKDLNTKVQAAAGGSGGGKGPNVPMAAGDKPEDDPFASRASKSLEKLLLVGKQYEQAVAGLTEAEIVKVNQRLEQLKKSETQAEILAKLAGLEKERFDILTEASEVLQGSSGFAKNRIALGDLGVQGPLTRQDDASIKRYDQQIIAATKLQTTIKELTIAGQQNERQVISTVKEQARQGQVTEALTQNMRKEIDAKLQNAQAGKTATSMIKAQMQEQVNAQKEVQRQTQSLMNTWVTSRYALYDVGNFYQSVAQNLIRVSRQIFDTTQSYRNFETSFTSIERAMQLTGAAAFDLRDQFIKLSEEIPVTFEDISRIATLGAQMGINADGVIEFTRTVAEFSAITGMSAETVAQQFGRVAELADVDSTEYRNLGSAVAFAGINAVATEEEILKLAVGISAVSNQAGFSAESIIGMSTALASVAIPAEQARGVFTRVFAKMDRSASQGISAIEKLNNTVGMSKGEFNQYDKSAKQLEAFAKMAGLSAEEFSKAWGPDGESEKVFYQMLQGLNATTDLTKAFDELGIVNVRDINTLTRLSANLDVVEQALRDSNVAFEEGIFLGDAFEKTADNLDAKIIVFKNNFDSLSAAFAAGIAGPLKNALDWGSSFLKFLKGASESPIFNIAALPIAAFIAFGAAFALVGSAVAKVTAQVYAFRVAMVNAANDPTAVAGLGKQIKSLLGLGSGMIEMRDQVSGINEKGLIEPVNYTGLFIGEKKQAAQLLEKRNIYLSLGNVAEEAMGKEKARALTSVQLSRKEADAVNSLIAAKKLQIETLEKSDDPAKIALGAKMREASSTSYVVAVGGEIAILNERERAEYRNQIATSKMDAALKKKTLAHIDSANAVNLESKAAASGIGVVGNALGKLIGIVSIVTIAITAIDMLYNAFVNLNKVDLALSGGGIESLREAIKKDTAEVKKGTMEAVTTVTVGYKEVSAASDTAAIAINRLTGTQSLAEKSMRNTTETARQQTLAIGENTKVWLANAIAKNEELQKIDLSTTKETLDELGMNFDGVLKDMAAAASGADIDPLKNLNNEIAATSSRYEEMLMFLATAGDALMRSDPERYAREAESTRILGERLNELRAAKTALEGIGPVLASAFKEMSNIEIINNLLGITTNAILDLSDAFAEAETSGEGMEDVLFQVQEAVIKVAGITSADDLFKIRTTSSVKALLEVVKTMYEAARAADNLRGASLGDLQQDRAMASRSPSAGAQAAVAALDAQIAAVRSGAANASASTEALKNALTSIQSILAGSGGGLQTPAAGKNTPEGRIRTLTDYANDLRSVLQSAFDIRYQRQVGLDAINSSWINLTKSAKDAQEAVKSANNEINKSIADKDVLQYQLSVAERYNDEKRAAVIREKLAKLDTEIISQQERLAEANENNNKTLTGNSRAAIDNRSKVRDLVTQYNSYLVALANSGMSSQELKNQTAALEQEFLNQGEALGYSRDELALYTNAFRSDFATVINNLPKNITLAVNTDPALRAIEEFVAKAKSALSSVGVAVSTAPPPPPPPPASEESQANPEAERVRANMSNMLVSNEVRRLAGVTSRDTADLAQVKIDRYLEKITKAQADSIIAIKNGNVGQGFNWIARSAGGYVSGRGTSTSDSIPAMLSNGEYVVKAKSVSAYGLDFMNALNEQRVGFSPAQSSSVSIGGGSSVVYLSPEDRALLRAAVDRPIALYTENSKIAQSANAGNVLLAQRGSK